MMVAGSSYAFHSVQFHPTEPRLLIAANQKTGIGLWDIRSVGSFVEGIALVHVLSSVADPGSEIRDPVLFYPLDPDLG
jgi:hypothetical protein